MLRKSILGIFGEIVLKLYTGAKQEEAAKNARDQVESSLQNPLPPFKLKFLQEKSLDGNFRQTRSRTLLALSALK